MSAYLNNVSYVNSLGKKWPLPLLLPDLKKFSKEVIWSLSDTMCNLIFVQETSKLQQNYLVRLFFSRVTEPLLWRTVKITAPLQMFFFTLQAWVEIKHFVEKNQKLWVRDSETKSAAHMKHWQSRQLFSPLKITLP